MLFKLAEQPFEDNRVTPEQFAELKKKLPMGQVPMLEVDGVQLVQSLAINKFLAERFGFAGKTDIERAQVDMAVCCVEDLTPRVLPLYDFGDDKEGRAKYAERYRTQFLLPGLANVEKLLKQNNGGDGFFVGDVVTWADLMFVNLGDYVIHMCNAGPVLEQFPKLKALKARVEALPKIAAWIAERPVTDM